MTKVLSILKVPGTETDITRPGIEPGTPWWEASTIEKSHSNSLLIATLFEKSTCEPATEVQKYEVPKIWTDLAVVDGNAVVVPVEPVYESLNAGLHQMAQHTGRLPWLLQYTNKPCTVRQ